ncbi:hypothetical protein C5167_034354 [Papaver somniferum]|uniref:Uncharacterized protein n=1 Tax=Papaver somniferum TaxID=3469 RepID=A0A4Y7KE80_PAPSO|nr:hypothetical protein C5167_034354 [Papaver somniferum]
MPTYTATMNHLNKPFIKTLSSQSTINHILTRVFVLQKSQLYSTSPKEPELVSKSRDWPRPITIPWQSKVANLVNLVGSVSRPIKFQESDDGKFWAGTTISQEEADHSTAIEEIRQPAFRCSNLINVAYEPGSKGHAGYK